MESFVAPAPDPDRAVSAFARSREEDHALGIFTQEEVAAAQEEEEEEEKEGEVRCSFKLGMGWRAYAGSSPHSGLQIG